MRMYTKKLTVLAQADMMLVTDGSVDSLVAACHRVFDATPPWAPVVCAALARQTGGNFHYYSRHELAELLWQRIGLGDGGEGGNEEDGDGDAQADMEAAIRAAAEAAAWSGVMDLPPLRRYCIDAPVRPPRPAWLAALALPELSSVGALAAWLNEPVGALGWFADQWRLGECGQERLQHYHYRWVPKRSGGVRLIEIPKARLRRLQQRILREILDRVPPHPAAHGFRRGHSCVTHAALHTGQHAVIRLDLKDFFPGIPLSRIHALFEKLGYPASVAGTLARICVNRTHPNAFKDQRVRSTLTWAERHAQKSPHLPQGSPCSPALANLCAYRLDLRLAALADSLGAAYSRYADDLAFSGGVEFARRAERFQIQVAAIALEEGFKVNHRKTRLMRAATRQQVTGVVVNSHPNIARGEYDTLKATLTNCVRHGPAAQNRDQRPDFRAYLAGRIAHVKMVNAARAARLRRLFDAIAWPA